MAVAGMHWDTATYESLAQIMRARAGLIFQGLRRQSVEAAAARVMARIGINAPETFVPMVAQEGAVFDDLMAEVTIGETYFFREPGHFTLLREEIIPDFKRRAGTTRRFRAWSAAASTGEEPYSIAIALREEGIDAEVVGTDISRARLAAARRAMYRRWSFRGVPDATIARYFKPAGDAFCLLSQVKRDVDLGYLNLASDAYPSMSSGVFGMDVIFCRNVLIYFDTDTIAHVARRLLASLAEGGWILLGATDPPLSDYVDCEVVQTPAGLVYRRTGSRTRVSKRPAPPLELEPVKLPEPAPPPLPLPIPLPPPPPPRPVLADSGIAPAMVEPAVEPAIAAAARIRELANAGRLDEAGRACAAALDEFREVPELHYLHAVLVAQGRQYAESARAARRALYLDRSMIVAHSALGSALARTGDLEAARRAFHNAERLLGQMAPDAEVPFSGGEPAARMLQMTRMQSRLTARGA